MKFSGCSDGSYWPGGIDHFNESMNFKDPKESDYPQLFDDPSSSSKLVEEPDYSSY